MARFWGNHPGTRQVRGFRKVKQATPEERLASMYRELANREQAYGPDHWLTTLQRETIAREERGECMTIASQGLTLHPEGKD